MLLKNKHRTVGKNTEICNYNMSRRVQLHYQFCKPNVLKIVKSTEKVEKIEQFRRKLTAFLLQHIFYSIDEYLSYYLVKYSA